MNKPIQTSLAMIIVGLSVVTFFSTRSGTSSSVSVSQKANHAPSSSETYALRGTDNSWPPASDDQVVVSNNILADNYYLIVDTSGSMNDPACQSNQPKIDVARNAIVQFVNKLPADANIGLLLFDNGKSREIVAIAANQHDIISRAVSRLNEGSGGTPLGTSIKTGYHSLTEQAKSQLGYGEYHLVVVTDGVANEGNEPDAPVRNLLKNSPVNLHTIGFCIDENHALNLPGHTIYKAASNPQALMAGLDSVLAEAPNFQVSDFGE